jgi:hypothetical protein
MRPFESQQAFQKHGTITDISGEIDHRLGDGQGSFTRQLERREELS